MPIHKFNFFIDGHERVSNSGIGNFCLLKADIPQTGPQFHKINEKKGLRGGVLQYAAQGIPQFDEETVEKCRFWMDTVAPYN